MSLITCKKLRGRGETLSFLLAVLFAVATSATLPALADVVVDLDGATITYTDSSSFGQYVNKELQNGTINLNSTQQGSAGWTEGTYTIGSGAIVNCEKQTYFNNTWTLNLIDGGEFNMTSSGEIFYLPFRYGNVELNLSNGGKFTSAADVWIGGLWNNKSQTDGKNNTTKFVMTGGSTLSLASDKSLKFGTTSSTRKAKTVKNDIAITNSFITLESGQIILGESSNGIVSDTANSYTKITFGPGSEITTGQIYADGPYPSPYVTFDGATIHWNGKKSSFIGHRSDVGDVYEIQSNGLTIDIPSGKSLTCDQNASSLKGEGGITKIGEGSITWNKVSSNGSQGMTFTGPMVVSNGMWTSTLGYASKAFRADGGTLVLSGSLSAENIVLAATKGGSLKLEGADVADNSPGIELASGGTTDYFTRDGVVGTYALDSLTLKSNAVLDIDGNAEAIDAITATALNIEATSDNPATININFSEVPKTGQVFSLFAVDDIAKLNIQPKLGSLVVPHSVSTKDGVAVLTITADDFVWNGTSANWSDEGAWTKGAEVAWWTDGNNAVFSIHNSSAILDASASVAELHFSANAVISAKEGEESPSLLTASNIIVDEGVTGTISAALSQEIEKTGLGTLELSLSREGKTTTVTEGTIKFTDSVNVGNLVLGTDIDKSVALDYSGNKLTGKINSYMNIATSSGGNATLKNGEYQYTETFRVWNGSLTIAEDATVVMDSSANRWVCVGGNNADSESATDVDARLIIDGGSITNNTGSHLGVGDFGSAPSKATMIVKNGGTYVGKSNAYIAQGAEGHLIVDGDGSSVTVSTLYFNGETRDEEGEDGYVSVTNGGLVAVKGITRNKGNANGYFNFDGGTLKATASGTLIAAHEKFFVNVNAAGGTIDNGGFDVTVTEDLIGAGELTLAGEGTTTIAGKLEVGALKVSKGSKLAFSSLNADTAAAKASEFIFKDGSSIVLPKSLAMGSYKLFELSSGEFSSDVLAKCSIEGIAIPYELKVEGNLIKILIDKNCLLFKNMNKTSQEITGEVSFYGEGALDAETLTFTEKAKLILDPIKTPVYIWGSEEGKGFIFANGAKIALSPNYAGMTCGKITLMTFKSEYARNLPENLDDVFDASSIATGAEWSITLEDVADANVYRKNLVLTVGDYENAPEIKILPIGDSITQGVTKDSQGDYPQYRTAIAARLAANGYKPKMVGVWKYAPKNAANVVMSEDWVWHCGISGDGIKTSPNTASSQRGGVRDNLHLYLDIAGYADVITLLIGTNDIGAGDAADEVYASFKALIENISAERPNAKIIGATLLDRNESTSENHQKIIAFNDLLKSDWAAKKLPSNFVLLDLYSMVPITSDNFFTDKLHLNWAGCSLTSEAFAEKIMEALPLSGENAFGGTQDDTVTDEAQVALGADVLVPETYRGGMERAFVIDAETPANVFTKASPYTSVGASVSLTRKVKRAGYYMELVRAGTSRRRFVWVDFDAEGKTLDDIDFPWSGENMQFIAENMHVYSNDSSIRNVSSDKVGVKGIIEGTYHNYTAPDALEGAPKDVFGSSDTYGWNDTMGSGNAGYGCFQAHRIFSQEEGDAHWNDAQVLFAWNRWGSSTATDEIGIGDYACHANGVGNTMDYTWTSEKGTDGLPDTVTASAYQVRRLEIWASFEEEARTGVWTGAAGNNLLSDENNWSNNTLPGTEDTVFIGVSDDVELVCDGAFAVNAIEISGDGKLEISGSGSIAVASSIIRMGASRPVINVPVEFKSGDEYVAIDVTGEVDFQGGVTGTIPVNHTTFYGNYTLKASSWDVSKAFTLAENATVSAGNTTINTSGTELLNSKAGSTLIISRLNLNVSGNIFGTFAGNLTVNYIYQYNHGGVSFNSGFSGVLRVNGIHHHSGSSVRDFAFKPDSSATIIIGGGSCGIEMQRGYFQVNGYTFHSSGNWEFDITNSNYGGDDRTGRTVIGENGIIVDTSHYDDPTLEGHTVSVNNSSDRPAHIAVIGAGGMTAIGNGTFKFNTPGTFTGGFTASNDVTVVVKKGVYPGKGDVTIRDTATLKLVDSASGTVPVAGKLTMEGGSTLHVPQFSASVVPISVNSLEFVNVENNKKVALKIDSGSLINGYNVILESDNAIPENAWSMIDVDISSDSVSIPEGMETSYVTQGNALCILVKGANDCIWTGSGEAPAFSEQANWRDGKTPSNGANLYIPASSDITIINDIENFSPASITFSAGSGAVTIDGEEAIKVTAITNLSSSSHTINVPVYFNEAIAVVQNARGYKTRSESHIVFSGGAYANEGETIASWDDGYSWAVFGNYVYSNNSDSPYTVKDYKRVESDDIRFVVGDNSTLFIPYAGDMRELEICSGSVVNVGEMRLTGSKDRVTHKNLGEIVVTNLILTGKDDRFLTYDQSGNVSSVFKFMSVTNELSSNWFYLSDGNKATRHTVYVGELGLNFSQSATGAYCIGRNVDGNVETIRPWYSDFVIADHGNTNARIVFNREVIFCTDDENGVGRKITVDTVTRGYSAPTITVSGSGILQINKMAQQDKTPQPPVSVIDTATLAYKPGASLGSGLTTVNAGATFQVAESGEVALDGDLNLADGAKLKFTFSKRNIAPVLDVAEKTVTLGENKALTVAIDGVKRPCAGRHVLTSGGKFAEAVVSLDGNHPKWVLGVGVNDDGNIYADIKPIGTRIIVR